jgi:hypothetical protein
MPPRQELAETDTRLMLLNVASLNALAPTAKGFASDNVEDEHDAGDHRSTYYSKGLTPQALDPRFRRDLQAWGLHGTAHLYSLECLVELLANCRVAAKIFAQRLGIEPKKPCEPQRRAGKA